MTGASWDGAACRVVIWQVPNPHWSRPNGKTQIAWLYGDSPGNCERLHFIARSRQSIKMNDRRILPIVANDSCTRIDRSDSIARIF
jgi:hypothetical protein